ncbi:MAG: hypothetical protein ACRD1F_06575, partial [Terriglobales bacterium]
TEISDGLDLSSLAGREGTVYAIGSSALWQSANQGQSWSPLPVPGNPAPTPTALASAPDGIWIGTSTGALIAPDGSVESACSAPVSAITTAGSNVWAACGTTVVTSVDAGAEWQNIAALPSPVVALAADATQPGLVAAADSSGVEVSYDNGKTWTAAPVPDDGAPVTALAFDAGQTLWAATLGRGLWSADYSVPPAQPEPPVIVIQSVPASVAAGTQVQIQASVQVAGTSEPDATLQYAASEGNDSLAPVTGTPNLFQAIHPGTVDVQVSATGSYASAKPVIISFQVTTAAAAKLVVMGGAGQSGAVGDKLLSPIVLEADDAYGNPVSGVTVAFAGGAFAPASATTGANGQVSTELTLPPQPGTLTLTATAAALPPVSWQETAHPPPDFSLMITAPAAPAPPDQPVTLTVTVAAVGGFEQAVALLCTEPAAGCQITPSTVNPGASATITIVAASNQASLPVSILGSAGALQHIATATLALPAFSMAASSATLNVKSGGTSPPLSLQLTPQNGLSGPVQFVVALDDGSPLPVSLSPAFQPTAAALPASGAAVQVQFAVAAASAATGALTTSPDRSAPWLGLGLLLLGAGLLGWRRSRRCCNRRAIAVAALGLLLAACGGGPGPVATPTPAPVAPRISSYSLQVTATVNHLTASIPVTLTVTQ